MSYYPVNIIAVSGGMWITNCLPTRRVSISCGYSISPRKVSVGRFVLEGIEQGRLPSLFDCEDRFMPVTSALPDVTIEQYALSHYQALLQGGAHE